MIRSIIISLLLLSYLGLSAQTPSSFKYQTSVRDNTGKLLANKLVAFKISLLQGNENGTAVYVEKHSIATNDFGVANFNIGGGIPLQGIFTNVDWGNGPYFLKIDLDLNNGTNYVFMGTSQLLSVPYALYAAKSANAADDKDKDSTNEIQNVTLTGNNLQLSKNGGNVDLSKYATDTQSLTLSGNTLSISRGNSIVLSGAIDLDADPTNEIQSLSLIGDSLTLSKANKVRLPKDNDTSSINEIQSLSINGDTLRLLGANLVLLPKSIDNDTLNELQTIQQTGNNLSLTKNGGSVSVPSVNNVQNGSILYATATGINTINLTLIPAPTAYTIGMMINFKMPNTNTGHVTINLNGLGAKALFKNSADTIISGQLLKDKVLTIIYDGLKFQVTTEINNNEVNAAKFVYDTLSNKSPIFYFFGWKRIPLNNTIYNFGNSITRSGDTIILQPGIYEIDCTIALMSAPGYVRLRLKNQTDNTTSLTSIGTTLYSYSTLRMHGMVQVTSIKRFFVEVYSNDQNAIIGVYNTPTNLNGEREILHEIGIKKL